MQNKAPSEGTESPCPSQELFESDANEPQEQIYPPPLASTRDSVSCGETVDPSILHQTPHAVSRSQGREIKLHSLD